uniref:Uncharacterized protein n=1 Tax=Oryza sativa subsp. japonica TaxID=39947 RepID=Q8H5U4_ORYSJ|nr:hypothetical protein [Oryza sativa Japonica Group]
MSSPSPSLSLPHSLPPSSLSHFSPLVRRSERAVARWQRRGRNGVRRRCSGHDKPGGEGARRWLTANAASSSTTAQFTCARERTRTVPDGATPTRFNCAGPRRLSSPMMEPHASTTADDDGATPTSYRRRQRRRCAGTLLIPEGGACFVARLLIPEPMAAVTAAVQQQAADGEGDGAGAHATGPRVAVSGIAGVELVAAVDDAEAGLSDEVVEKREVQVPGHGEDVANAHLHEAARQVAAKCGVVGGSGRHAPPPPWEILLHRWSSSSTLTSMDDLSPAATDAEQSAARQRRHHQPRTCQPRRDDGPQRRSAGRVQVVQLLQ